MNPFTAPAQPYAPDAQRGALPGRLELKVQPDRAYAGVPSSLGVRYGASQPTGRLDGGGIDRVLRRHSAGVRVSRSYTSRRHAADPERGHLDWDGLEHEFGLSRTFRVDLDPAADLLAVCDDLRRLEGVEEVGPAYLSSLPFGASLRRAGDLSVFDLIGAAEAQRMEPGDPTVIVAIIDSGVTAGHPELTGRVRKGADTVDLVSDLLTRVVSYQGRPRSFHDASDTLGHGTACAGIISARGLSLPRGLGGLCQVLPMRCLTRIERADSQESTAVGSIPDINAGVKLAVDLGAKVLNLSFGTPDAALRSEDPLPHAGVIAYALARGAIPIAASGNRGDDTRYFPACLPGVIAVGSASAARRPSSFTCHGPHVALCAPGERVPCAGVDGYCENTGTSFAAPFVAAAVALMVARAHKDANPLDAAAARSFLMESASPFAPDPTDSRLFGAGILDVPAALRLVDESNRGPPELRLFPSWRGRARPQPEASRTTNPRPPAQPGAK